MDLLDLLLLTAGILAGTVTFLVARFPHFRRPQFRDGRPWPLPAALVAGIVVFVVFTLALFARR